MKMQLSILFLFAAGAARAHESLVPHRHPHATSVLPDSDTLGIAVLVAALAVIVIAQFKRGNA